MKKILLPLLSFILGGLLGLLAAQHYELSMEFPRIMAIRMILFNELGRTDPNVMLRLLDVYDGEIHHQMDGIVHLQVDWREELFQSQLKRYVVLNQLGDVASANQALIRAADLHKGVNNIDFLRELALRMYTPSSSEPLLKPTAKGIPEAVAEPTSNDTKDKAEKSQPPP